jgi:hypothetical protein
MQTPNNRSARTRKTSPLPPIKISVHRHEVRENNLDSGLVRAGRAKSSPCCPYGAPTRSDYKHLLQNPLIRIDARGVEAEFRAIPITDAKMVKSVVEK